MKILNTFPDKSVNVRLTAKDLNHLIAWFTLVTRSLEVCLEEVDETDTFMRRDELFHAHKKVKKYWESIPDDTKRIARMGNRVAILASFNKEEPKKFEHLLIPGSHLESIKKACRDQFLWYVQEKVNNQRNLVSKKDYKRGERLIRKMLASTGLIITWCPY